MNITFATCNRARALGFLRQIFPLANISDSPDCAGPMLDLVEQDVIRIQDPMMHGQKIQVIPGRAWVEDETRRAEVIDICIKFNRSANLKDSLP